MNYVGVATVQSADGKYNAENARVIGPYRRTSTIRNHVLGLQRREWPGRMIRVALFASRMGTPDTSGRSYMVYYTSETGGAAYPDR